METRNCSKFLVSDRPNPGTILKNELLVLKKNGVLIAMTK